MGSTDPYFFLFKFFSIFRRLLTHFAQIEYSFFADLEAASTGLGGSASFAMLAVLGLETLVVGLAAFGFSWVEGWVLLNLRKLGVMFLCVCL